MFFKHQFKVTIAIPIFFMLLLYSCAEQQKVVEQGITPVDQVYPLLDSENSRWFFFASASRPFGMVNLSPDTQIGGAWGSGYRYNTDTIKGFSHIHAWQLSGLSVMPVTITESNQATIFADFYSKFSHETEEIAPGYHYLKLDRYNIEAQLTSTKRVGMHKYSFTDEGKRALLVNLNTLLGPCQNGEGFLELIDENRVKGHFLNLPTLRRPKSTKVFFQIESNTKIKDIKQDDATGNYLIFFDDNAQNVLLKAGISYTSNENAAVNIGTELSHWDFDQVVKASKEEWNNYLGRIKIEGGTASQQRRFYTDLWHALQGRRVISDVNGAYPDYTGDEFRIGQIPLDDNGKPTFNHYNSDSFWGAQWTLNTLWGLVYPEIYHEFVHSLMQYYKDGGLVPRGPSGGNYTYVMTGASSTPFIVSAIQKGIINDGLEEIYQALRKNHMPGGIMEKAGYEHSSNTGGGLVNYIDKGYVPHPNPDGGTAYHRDGASLTLEYAYQDWVLAQLAKKLNYSDDYNYFLERSKNYSHVFDAETGWMRPKDLEGKWKEDFDPFEYKNGFIEANSAQATWFVPHDLSGLAQLMGGKKQAIEKLNEQFEAAEKLNFTSGDSHDVEQHPEYRRIPVNYGNQPSIQTAFIFNHLGRPDLAQYWSKQVVDKAYSQLGTGTGYSGDEDQGLMGSLVVLMKIGLFQVTGGTEENPVYEIGSPLFDKVEIQLHPDFYPGEKLVISKSSEDGAGIIVDEAIFNNSLLDEACLDHNEIVKGGTLMLKMSNDLKN